MAFYSKEQLEIERAAGLQLTDAQNERESFEHEGETMEWSQENFEQYLTTKDWHESIKDNHRKHFKGKIKIGEGSISYPS